MRRLFMILISLLVMLLAGYGADAQDVEIELLTGWNYIAYPYPTSVDLNTFLGSYTPMQGDMIKSQWGSSQYTGGKWRGAIKNIYPGEGYKYLSNNPDIVTLVLTNPIVPEETITVTTGEPTDITAESAIISGEITLLTDTHVFMRGVCWGTTSDPDIDGSYFLDGEGEGSFTVTLDELTPNTTYYVRVYAVSDHGLAYGEEQNFTTLENSSNIPEGAINGLFTINANGDQVYFSQGNLQYQASTNTWRFAENQWDYVGEDNSNISQTYEGWIDLFGWGTSGYNNGATCYQPWSTNAHHSLYNPYGSKTTNLYDNTGQADWGYNSISNGGNTENYGWRTLRMGEWNSVMFGRTTASNVRFAKAIVNNVGGIIVLPDDWDTLYYVLESANDGSADFSANIISTETWVNNLEFHGAVFLPAAGWRIGNTAYVHYYVAGAYWSSSHWDIDTAYSLQLYNDETFIDHESLRYMGYSVRLVRDVE